MKKVIYILLTVILGINIFWVPSSVSAEEEKKSIPRLDFYGGVDQLRSKEEEIKIQVKYNSDDIKFNGYAKIKWQGSSSIAYAKKNYTIKFYKDANLEDKLKIDFGWGKQNKYCLKANWIDKTHSRNVVTAKLAAKMQKKYKLLEQAPKNGVIDGFPIEIYLNNNFLGLYTLNIPKDAWMFGMDDDNPKHTVLAGETYNAPAFFKETVTEFYDFGLEAGVENQETLNALNRLIVFVRDSSDEEFRNNISNYLNLDSMLNYYCFMQVAQMKDNNAKNMLLVTYDHKVWYTSLYDLDTTWGTYWDGSKLYNYNNYVGTESILWNKMKRVFADELADRYFELREDILSKDNIMNEFNSFYNSIPKETWIKENNRWKNIPGYDLSQINNFLTVRLPVMDKFFADIYTKDADIKGYCTKKNNKITAKVVPLRKDVIIENEDSYTFNDDGDHTFIYKDASGNTKYRIVEVNFLKNAFGDKR